MIFEDDGHFLVNETMLDLDLAEIYGYSISAFNQQVSRNNNRFDEDFVFRLTKSEYENSISQM